MFNVCTFNILSSGESHSPLLHHSKSMCLEYVVKLEVTPVEVKLVQTIGKS